MRVVFSVLLGILFIPLFLLFLLATSIRFQVLQEGFILNSFQKNHSYDRIPGFLDSAIKEQERKMSDRGSSSGQEEIESYTAIVQNIKPELIQEIIETNIKETILFLNGEIREPALYVPFEKLGIETRQIAPEKIPLSVLAPNFPREWLVELNKTGMYALLIWVLSLLLLGGIIFGTYKLNKKVKSIGIMLLINSVVFIILEILVRFFLYHMDEDLKNSIEPSQRILSMFASSVFPEMVNTWIFITILLAIAGVVLLFWERKVKGSKT